MDHGTLTCPRTHISYMVFEVQALRWPAQALAFCRAKPHYHLHSPSYWKISPSCPDAHSSPCPPMDTGSIFFLFPTLCVVMQSRSLHLCLTPCPQPPVPTWEALHGHILCSHYTHASPSPGQPTSLKMDSGPKPLTPERDISSIDSCHLRRHLSVAMVGSSLF